MGVGGHSHFVGYRCSYILNPFHTIAIKIFAPVRFKFSHQYVSTRRAFDHMQGAQMQSATSVPTKTVAVCSVNVPAELLLGHGP